MIWYTPQELSEGCGGLRRAASVMSRSHECLSAGREWKSVNSRKLGPNGVWALSAGSFPESCSVGRRKSDALIRFNTLRSFFAPCNFGMVICDAQLPISAAELGLMLDAAFRFVLKDSPQLTSVGDGAEELLGFSREDFLTSKIALQDRVHRDDAPRFASLFSSDLQHPTGKFNIRLRHSDGKIRCVKGIFKKARSTTNEIELELHLEDARTVKEPGDAILMASFKSLIEHTTDYIYIKNRNHVILAASQSLPNLTDWAKDRSDLVGTTDYDNHPEATADVYYQLEEKAFAEGQRVDQIQEVPAQDGTKRWIDNRKYPINGLDGEIIGVFGVAPDISEAINTRTKLHESEEWLRDAQEIAGLSSYVLDIPNQQWIVSPELATLLGIGADYDRGFEHIWPL
ncbi:MAG: PAS domain-containing protein, partial [Terracidiphilus sp.]